MKINKKDILKIFEILEGAYQEFQKIIKDESKAKVALNTWYECLKDLEYRDIEPIIYKIIKTSKYMPTIAEIREKVGNIRRLPDGTYIKDGLHYMN